MRAGERIREKRLELGMTQDELAQKAGYKSRSSINKIERCRELSVKKADKIAKVLGCTPGYLLGWEGEHISYEKLLEKLEEYQAIGTVEEFMALKEQAKIK